jgi:hypothetical protein
MAKLPYEFITGSDSEASHNQDGTWQFTRQTIWNLYGVRPIVFLFSRVLPARGSLHNTIPVFYTDTKTIREVKEFGHDSRQVTIDILFKSSLGTKEYDAVGQIFPWLLPAQNYRVASTGTERTVRELYKENGSVIDMVNSAGSPIIVNSTRGQSSIRFEFYLQNFDENMIWQYANVVNSEPIRVAGMNYPPFTLRIDSLEANREESKAQDGSVAYYYWKIAVSLTGDPQTFNRKYLNSGTMARFGSASNPPTPIWTASEDATIKYGSREDMFEFNNETMEQISEPLFLTPEGMINGLTSDGVLIDGKNGQTYLEGIIEQPIPFQPIGFPLERF